MQSSAAAILERWSEAERRGSALDLLEVLADQFVGVGPVGFVLSRETWVARFADGWAYESLVLDDVTFRGAGDWRIGVGTVSQEGVFQGRRTEGRFRATFVLDIGHGKVVAIQFTPIAEPPKTVKT
ncbi:nuclear transport factor 2 family protein [Rhizobium leguminosarum]|uniref:nuclear transport factor 2 family protein n=1 Tax=Rhizobium leguminosarum TaxID=384 RepID=UPI0014423ABE|nr:nuclear transport factor 2 family protein [Rhizobium leguminosarum]MBY5816696.1 nuclear transport factor 2 family protein [Rhizobium leguminosarum]NKL02796.1 DUF4440 domain-containing protein [Rhizobium leguminosarum bv. viciae]